jgi:ribosomal protein L44E
MQLVAQVKSTVGSSVNMPGRKKEKVQIGIKSQEMIEIEQKNKKKKKVEIEIEIESRNYQDSQSQEDAFGSIHTSSIDRDIFLVNNYKKSPTIGDGENSRNNSKRESRPENNSS